MYQQATVTETTQKVRIITDQKQVQLGLDGQLELNGRQILVVKGGDTMTVASQVYRRFRNDESGKNFRFSRKLRGLTHIDKTWGTVKKISGPEMLEYISEWFQPCQLVSNANGPGLILLDAVPPLFGALIQQGRYSSIFADLFEWID